jgi:hypothetical protein
MFGKLNANKPRSVRQEFDNVQDLRKNTCEKQNEKWDQVKKVSVVIGTHGGNG